MSCNKCNGNGCCIGCNGSGKYTTKSKPCHSCNNGSCNKCGGDGIYKSSKSCVACYGTGTYSNNITAPCNKCNSTGQQKHVKRCKYCNNGRCTKCNGYGSYQATISCKLCNGMGSCSNCNSNDNNTNNLIFKPNRSNYPVHGNKVLRLYHVTNENGAKGIQESGKMLRGNSGMFGGGIYFAESIEIAKYKAIHKGFLITAHVFVGRELVVKDFRAGSFTFNQLWQKGYDSIWAPKGSGNAESERAVYSHDQVKVVNIKKLN